MKRLSVIVLGCFFASIAASQEVAEIEPTVRRYTVEFVVFAYTEAVSIGSEVFPAEDPVAAEKVADDQEEMPESSTADETTVPAAPDGVQASDMAATDAAESLLITEYSRIAALLNIDDELTLQQVIDRLELLDVYEPLFWGGWSQIAPPKDEAEPLSLSFFGMPPEGLDGSLSLYLGRYLHLVVDMSLEEIPKADEIPLSIEEPSFSFQDSRFGYADPLLGAQQRIVFRIAEDRIVRNGDTRYFDHPKFGVIATVARVQTTEEAELSEEDLLPASVVGPGE